MNLLYYNIIIIENRNTNAKLYAKLHYDVQLCTLQFNVC